MRRKDREITNQSELFDLLSRCDTLRLGLVWDGRAYVVPVSFGVGAAEPLPCLYFHCARQGLKVDCLRADPRVCVEADVFHRAEPIADGITTRYESLIGFGTAREVTGEEKARGLQAILAHYGFLDREDPCPGAEHALVFRIDLEEWTGKRNL